MNWKIIAWIFIVIAILEGIYITYAYSVGAEMIDNEIECSNQICYDADANSFYYDSSTKTCYCYDAYGEVKLQRVIK